MDGEYKYSKQSLSHFKVSKQLVQLILVLAHSAGDLKLFYALLHPSCFCGASHLTFQYDFLIGELLDVINVYLMLLELQKAENADEQCTVVCFPLMICYIKTFIENDYVMPCYEGGW